MYMLTVSHILVITHIQRKTWDNTTNKYPYRNAMANMTTGRHALCIFLANKYMYYNLPILVNYFKTLKTNYGVKTNLIKQLIFMTQFFYKKCIQFSSTVNQVLNISSIIELLLYNVCCLLINIYHIYTALIIFTSITFAVYWLTYTIYTLHWLYLPHSKSNKKQRYKWQIYKIYNTSGFVQHKWYIHLARHRDWQAYYFHKHIMACWPD